MDVQLHFGNLPPDETRAKIVFDILADKNIFYPAKFIAPPGKWYAFASVKQEEAEKIFENIPRDQWINWQNHRTILKHESGVDVRVSEATPRVRRQNKPPIPAPEIPSQEKPRAPADAASESTGAAPTQQTAKPHEPAAPQTNAVPASSTHQIADECGKLALEQIPKAKPPACHGIVVRGMERKPDGTVVVEIRATDPKNSALKISVLAENVFYRRPEARIENPLLIISSESLLTKGSGPKAETSKLVDEPLNQVMTLWLGVKAGVESAAVRIFIRDQQGVYTYPEKIILRGEMRNERRA